MDSLPGVFPHVAAPPPLQPVPYGVEIANRVFVGGCPYDMTELQLMEFFSKFGEVKDAKIITDREGGKSRGYGFVTFATEKQATDVYSKGSIYYEQKKLNVSKAVRKYGGQYQKANQEYVNGQQQRLIWLHPNGCLVTQQETGWQTENFISHSQSMKPCYPMPPQLPPNLYYGPAGPYMPHPHAGHAPPMYSNMYNCGPSYHPTYYSDEQYDRPINIIATNSHTSTENSPFFAPPPPAGQEYGGYLLEMGALELKTKHLSLDSAYTSEADLDSSQAASSGTVSPKDPEGSEKVLNGHISGLPGLNEEQLISSFSETTSRSAEEGVVKSLPPAIQTS